MRVVYALSTIIFLAFASQDTIAWGLDSLKEKIEKHEQPSNNQPAEINNSRYRLESENQRLSQLNLLLQQKTQILEQQNLQLRQMQSNQELNDAGRKP